MVVIKSTSVDANRSFTSLTHFAQNDESTFKRTTGIQLCHLNPPNVSLSHRNELKAQTFYALMLCLI